MPTGAETLRIVSQFDVAGIQAGMGQAVDAVEAGTARMNTRFNRLGTESEAAMNKVAFSSTEARHALHGLGEEMGVHVPRFVQTFVAHMGGIGPLLASAFSAIAVVGLLQVLAEVPEAIDKIVGKITGWDKEARKAYADMVQGNRQLQIENLKLEDQMARIALIGKSGSERSTLQMQLLGKSTQDTGLLLVQFMRQLREMEEELHKMTIASDPRARLGQPFMNWLNKSEIEQKKQSIEGLRKAIQELENQLREAPVKKAEAGAEDIEARMREAERYRDTLDKIYTEETKLSQETVGKELREFERLAAERERLDEEMEKTTFDMAKKDLDTFERSMVDKVKLQEEAGRGQLEQIRANAEMQQRVVAATSVRGGADPRLIKIADDALDEQAFKIMELIDLEEQLRAKFLAAGMAETDPKIQESLARQAQLVQQLTVATQKFDSTSQAVALKMLTNFKHSFEQITIGLNRGVISWINGQESFGRAAAKVWTGLADSAIESVLKMGESWLEGILLKKALALITKQTDASTAASGAYASQAAIPIIGPELGTAAAAVAYAEVMSFAAGGIVPRGGLAMLHSQEMVLPAPIAQKVQNMAGSGGGVMHVHLHAHGGADKKTFLDMEDELVAMVKRAQRRGRIDGR